MNRGKVLLVEDNAMNMELATDLLEVSGFQVLQATKGDEAVTMAVALQPDIILMDIALPGMDGLEATRRIKQDPRTTRIPVVALTASVMPGDVASAQEAGCCGHIHKPIDTRQFAKAVAEFMGKEGT